MLVEERRIVVTGAARGIGKAIAEAYAKDKCIVFALDIDELALINLLQEANKQKWSLFTHVVDIRDSDDIAEFFSNIQENRGHVDVLINNAGIGKWTSPDKLTVKEWDDVLHTNLRGAFLCARAAARLMPEGGRIIQMASTRATMSEPHSESYAASKAGLLGLTHALAASYADRRITVNAISPGWIETTAYDQLRDIDHQQHWSRRVGTTSDIVRACFFLTDPANDFITGEQITIDGGMTRKMIYAD
ncbi:SDR family oxidoreductase [Bacillaceae bacterium SIJ1]|uniref:SDR family NAD(P)-dependent oxidoreductase n=1 Tax=Litoribacterium kuwaitense TaxID=1398745 RepID=UPI0013EB3799|nr:SDR family oxidoreductase [Litoribacterium kuwaitense]NGP46705.1 SDR family oxidoreductase [Litoribacterium kuwaitense]